MPTKRKRATRNRRLNITPAELEWLTGEPVEGANRFWKFVRGAEKVARCRELIALYGHLIPTGRLPQLERDIKFWTPPQWRGNGHAH